MTCFACDRQVDKEDVSTCLVVNPGPLHQECHYERCAARDCWYD